MPSTYTQKFLLIFKIEVKIESDRMKILHNLKIALDSGVGTYRTIEYTAMLGNDSVMSFLTCEVSSNKKEKKLILPEA